MFYLLSRTKKFVAHPNIQQLLASLWYEGEEKENERMPRRRIYIIKLMLLSRRAWVSSKIFTRKVVYYLKGCDSLPILLHDVHDVSLLRVSQVYKETFCKVLDSCFLVPVFPL